MQQAHYYPLLGPILPLLHYSGDRSIPDNNRHAHQATASVTVYPPVRKRLDHTSNKASSFPKMLPPIRRQRSMLRRRHLRHIQRNMLQRLHGRRLPQRPRLLRTRLQAEKRHLLHRRLALSPRHEMLRRSKLRARRRRVLHWPNELRVRSALCRPQWRPGLLCRL